MIDSFQKRVYTTVLVPVVVQHHINEIDETNRVVYCLFSPCTYLDDDVGVHSHQLFFKKKSFHTMDGLNNYSTTMGKIFQPERYLYVPGDNLCDWIVYDQGVIAFLMIGKVWYQRQQEHEQKQDRPRNWYFFCLSMSPTAAHPSIILTIPDLDNLWSLEVAIHLYKKPVYRYQDILVEWFLGLHPTEYTYLSTKHPLFPELGHYRDDNDDNADNDNNNSGNNIAWIVFEGRSPAFLITGDWVNGYDWYQRIRPTATFQYINNPLIPTNAATERTTTTNRRMIDMSYYHLTRISHEYAMDYDTFCTIEKIEARRRQKEWTTQIAKLQSDKLELGIMLAQMYSVGSMPRAPIKK
jgi:hypothetical protein